MCKLEVKVEMRPPPRVFFYKSVIPWKLVLVFMQEYHFKGFANASAPKYCSWDGKVRAETRSTYSKDMILFGPAACGVQFFGESQPGYSALARRTHIQSVDASLSATSILPRRSSQRETALNYSKLT